jgi:hypothetical protein
MKKPHLMKRFSKPLAFLAALISGLATVVAGDAVTGFGLIAASLSSLSVFKPDPRD